MVKNPPTMQELQDTQVLSLGQEDPSEEGAWQRTPVFLPGESHGQRSLAGYSPYSHKELDMTEATEHTQDVYVNLQPNKIRFSSMSVGLFLFCLSGSLFFF